MVMIKNILNSVLMCEYNSQLTLLIHTQIKHIFYILFI